MICFSCGFKIHDTNAAECQLCGVKFGAPCPSCKVPNPSMAQYCFSCGAPLQRKNTRGTVENFDSLAEARRNIAVIFADISGFTSLSETLDPEIVRDLINDCFAFITRPVYELGGTIDKYIGDCIMILFGARYPHPDDARRAVICSIKMLSLIREFSEEKGTLLGHSLDLSIGVHYGLVVTGSVGNYYDKDYTVMGDTVNTAQRIQSHVPKGTIYVSDEVYQQTRNDIEYTEPIEFNVKNKKKLQRCYIPVRITNIGNASHTEMEMIGRGKELNHLQKIFERSLDQPSQMITITGPGGIGKTRLVDEFIHKLGDRIKVIRVECAPSSVSKPYFILGSLLQNTMNISPGETLDIKKSRIISYVNHILGSEEDEAKQRNYQFLGLAMGVEVDTEVRNILSSMDAKSIQQEICKQVRHFLEAYAKKNKAVIILEDIHWGDSRSLTILNNIIRDFQGLHVMLICTSRNSIGNDEYIANEGIHYLHMHPLQKEDIQHMACEWMGSSSIDDSLIDYLEKFCGGNPLYLRELLLYLKNNDLYHIKEGKSYLKEDTSVIPNSLQSLILEKINDMDEKTADFLKIASIIGKEFPLSVINYLMQRDIEATGEIYFPMISLKSVYPMNGSMEKIYTFNQEIEREVIYNSLLLKQKKEYHHQIGEAIEFLYGKNLYNSYESLADHFKRAGVEGKAAEYYFHSAVKHKALYNFHESQAYFQNALECYGLSGKRVPKERLLTIYREMSEIQISMGKFEDACSNLESAVEYAGNQEKMIALKLMKARIYKEQGKYDDAMNILYEVQAKIKQSSESYGVFLLLRCSILRVTGEYEEALRVAKKAERILVKNKDYDSLAKTLNAAGVIYYSTGDIDNSLHYFNKSYQYSERVNDLQTMQKTSSNLGVIYHSLGKAVQAMGYFNTAMELSKKISLRQGYISNCINLGVLYLDKGYLNKGRELFDEALKNAEEISSRLYQSTSLTNLGDVEYRRRRYVEAEKYYKQALTISKDIDDEEGKGINLLGLAKIALACEKWLTAQGYLEDVYGIFEHLGNARELCDYYFYLGLYEIGQGHLDQSMVYSEFSIQHAKESKSEQKMARGLALKGRMCLYNQWYDQSLQLLSKAIAITEDEESEYETAKNYYFRAQTYMKLNEVEKGKQDLQTAKEYIRMIDPCKWTDKIERGIM